METDKRVTVVLVAGLATLVGSLQPWVSCSTVGCNSMLPSIDELSVTDVGYGVLTAIAAILLIAAGLHVRLYAEASRYRRLVTPLALFIVAVTAAFVLEVYLLPQPPPGLDAVSIPWSTVRMLPMHGAILVGLGGALALAAGVRLRAG